jgi:cell division septum initiation protein DivIVA
VNGGQSVADEALRRADELLSELIEIVETARALPMSVSCVLPRERVLDLLDELREVLPPEMDEARTVIASRERLLKDAYEGAAEVRQRAVTEADTVLADAEHQAGQILGAAQEQAEVALGAAKDEHGRLVAATTVHQAAAHAAAVLRADAEKYEAQISAEARQYDERIRDEADRYARDARSEAERYALKLTGDAEDYAERTLDELSAVLHRAAATAEQGRTTLAQRRATAWSANGPGIGGRDEGERSPISA